MISLMFLQEFMCKSKLYISSTVNKRGKQLEKFPVWVEAMSVCQSPSTALLNFGPIQAVKGYCRTPKK